MDKINKNPFTNLDNSNPFGSSSNNNNSNPFGSSSNSNPFGVSKNPFGPSSSSNSSNPFGSSSNSNPFGVSKNPFGSSSSSNNSKPVNPFSKTKTPNPFTPNPQTKNPFKNSFPKKVAQKKFKREEYFKIYFQKGDFPEPSFQELKEIFKYLPEYKAKTIILVSTKWALAFFESRKVLSPELFYHWQKALPELPPRLPALKIRYLSPIKRNQGLVHRGNYYSFFQSLVNNKYKKIKFNENYEYSIPDCIRSLNLNISLHREGTDNELTTKFLNNLTSLKELYIFASEKFYYKGPEIPELANYPYLESLKIKINGYHDITFLPNMTNLINLELNTPNPIFAPSHSHLTKLKFCDLSANMIFELPDLPSSIENLNISMNPISNISCISKFASLNYLNIKLCQIREIPDSIRKLTKMTFLDLSINPISELPYGLSQLSKLKVLSLDETNISELPPGISTFTNLELLGLSKTKIATLPDFISSFKNLTTLHMNHTLITSIPCGVSDLNNLKDVRTVGSPLDQESLDILLKMNINLNTR